MWRVQDWRLVGVQQGSEAEWVQQQQQEAGEMKNQSMFHER